MLDAHHHHFSAVTQRVTEQVNVTEKRAPTDESVKLLREMEAEAQKSIVASTRVADTPVECVIRHLADRLNCLDKFKIVYSLRGFKREVFYEYDSMVTDGEDRRREIATGLRDALAKDIATVLVSANLNAALRAGFGR